MWGAQAGTWGLCSGGAVAEVGRATAVDRSVFPRSKVEILDPKLLVSGGTLGSHECPCNRAPRVPAFPPCEDGGEPMDQTLNLLVVDFTAPEL